jgi:16S rRNA (guanine(966)-N(2))-methyltransferase RsmD
MRIIRGKYGRRRFDVPTNISARPTTDFARENIFNVMENLVDFEGDEPEALDLFAGTGAVSFEFLSRGCRSVTSVEKAAVQATFIRKVAQQLGADNHTLVRGDALRYIQAAPRSFDIVFADPPYDLPGFAEIPGKVLASRLLRPGSLFIIEHSSKHDFSALPNFLEHRAYGSVNFSLFRLPAATEEESAAPAAPADN